MLLAFAALFAARPAAAATSAGLCDERGLSAIAPLPVLPLDDVALDRDDASPLLCEVDATAAGCRLEHGREGPVPFLDVADADPTLGIDPPRVPLAPGIRMPWPEPLAASAPPGWRAPIDHPPRV